MSKATAKALWAIFRVLSALAARQKGEPFSDEMIGRRLAAVFEAITEGEAP